MNYFTFQEDDASSSDNGVVTSTPAKRPVLTDMNTPAGTCHIMSHLFMKINKL